MARTVLAYSGVSHLWDGNNKALGIHCEQKSICKTAKAMILWKQHHAFCFPRICLPTKAMRKLSIHTEEAVWTGTKLWMQDESPATVQSGPDLTIPLHDIMTNRIPITGFILYFLFFLHFIYFIISGKNRKSLSDWQLKVFAKTHSWQGLFIAIEWNEIKLINAESIEINLNFIVWISNVIVLILASFSLIIKSHLSLWNVLWSWLYSHLLRSLFSFVPWDYFQYWNCFTMSLLLLPL